MKRKESKGDASREISGRADQTKKRFATLRKKKYFRPLVIIIIIAIIGLVAFFSLRAKAAKAKSFAASTTVQSSTATTGTVTNTISGTGTLANAESTSVLIPDGITIKTVLVSSGDTVKKGQKLATVDTASAAKLLLEVKESIDDVEDEIDDLSSDADDSSTDEYLEKVVLEKELDDLEAQKTTLTAIYKSGTITATCAGTIDAVNVSADSTSGSSSSSSSSGSTGSSSGSTAGGMTQTAAETTFGATDTTAADTTTADAAATSTTASTGFVMLTTTSSNTAAASASTESVSKTESLSDVSTQQLSALTEDTEQSTDLVTISDDNLSLLAVTAPVKGASPQTSLAATDYYTGTISWDCSGKFQAGSTYTATITLTAKDGYTFTSADEYAVTIAGATISADTPKNIGTADTASNKLRIKAVFQTAADTTSTSGSTTSGSNTTASGSSSTASGSNSGSSSSNTGSAGSSTSTNSTAASNKSTTSTSGTGSGSSVSGSISSGSASGSTSSTSGSSSSSSTSTSSSSSDTLSESAAFTIATADTMTVTVSVDELDINSVAVGQTASIAMDAFEDETFDGTISAIDTTATTSSGTSKYSVDVSMTKADGMLVGMSATATINIEEAQDVITIPVNALQEKGNSSFVYTQKDSDGNLSGEVEVETGVSDGTNVEIKSGLSEGDTVYYTKTTSSSSDSSSGFDPSGMGGKMGGQSDSGNMPDRSEMKSGSGSAPSGGGPSGNN